MSQSDLDRDAGAKLKELRQGQGLSQEDLSFAADIDQSTLSKVERLGPAAVGWSRFCKIVEALGHEAEITFRPASSASSQDSGGARRR